MAEISNQIDANPDSEQLRSYRRALLEQVGLGSQLER